MRYRKGAGLSFLRKDGQADRKLIACLEGIPLLSGRWLALKPQLFSFFLPMTQMKLGASNIARRLFKSAATSALALSAVAGGVMLSGGEAKALVSANCAPAPQPVPAITDNRFSVLGIAGPTPGPGVCDVELTDLGNVPINDPPAISPFIAPSAQYDIDYTPNFIGNGSHEYKITYLPGDSFIWSGMKLTGPGAGASSIVKLIYDDYDPGTKTYSNLLATLDSNTNTWGQSYKSKDNMIFVKATYPVVAPGIDNIQDYHQTPGPLPILGAGAAFGFSRKLRGRIKAARTA